MIVPTSVRQIPVAALFAAIVTSVATFYVLIGTGTQKRKPKKGFPRGLENVSGRSCYFNVVLQLLASSEIIQQWLSEGKSRLKKSLLKCVRSINEPADNEPFIPTDLYVALRLRGFVASRAEEDAHEMFQGLIDAIESDHEAIDDNPLALEEGMPLSGLSRSGQPLRAPQLAGLLDEPSPFRGTLTSRVDGGDDPESSPTRSVVFNNITLYLPPTGSTLEPISLENLLQSFVSLEQLEGSKCKQHSFARLPQCLCMHIQRTGYDEDMKRTFKRLEKVSFPLYLYMDKFMYSKQLCQRSQSMDFSLVTQGGGETSANKRNVFQLCAVICHLGGPDSGHYITYRRHRSSPGGKVRWFYTSDCVVHQVSLETVLMANPYILLYEKFPYSTTAAAAAAATTNTTSMPGE